MSLTVLSFALTILAANGAAKPLPAYADALNCAGVTQAASTFGKTPESAKAFSSTRSSQTQILSRTGLRMNTASK